MNLPVFTAPDPLLMRSDIGRDPLGLLPVWSEFGRKLVPNLAGPVAQIKGVTAVLLIHYVHEKLFAQASMETQVSYRGYFRLMEGLLEWFLWDQPGGERQHCFGTQTFSTGAAFIVTAADSRTVVNGLYQYYRGTCRRAGLLLADWIVAPDVAAAMGHAWSAEVSGQLEPVLRESLKDNPMPMIPASVLEKHAALGSALNAVFASPALNQLLYEGLFGAASHRTFAAYCDELLQEAPDADSQASGRTRNWVEKLSARLADGDPARPLRDNLDHITRCEPFLITVQDGFDYLRRSPGLSIAKVAAALAEHGDIIRQRGARFLELGDIAKNARSRQMLNVAEAAVAGVEEFLRAILEHHASVAEDRARDPMALLEGDKILAPAPPERETAAILLRLKNGYPWDNGYYLATAGNLYQQALKARHV